MTLPAWVVVRFGLAALRAGEALTWAACEKAISRFKKGKAVGSDLLDGYLLRT